MPAKPALGAQAFIQPLEKLLTGEVGGWDQSLAELQLLDLEQASVFWLGMAKNSCDISGWKAQLHQVIRGLLALSTEIWQHSEQKFLYRFMQDFSHPSCPPASLQAVPQVKAASSREKAEVCLGTFGNFLPKVLLTARVSKFNPVMKHRLHGTLQLSVDLSSASGSFALEEFHLVLSDRC